MTAIIVSKTHYLKCSSVITPGQVALVWAGSHFPRRLCRLCILIRPCTSLQGLCLGTDQQKCPWNIEDISITQWPINTSYSISSKIPPSLITKWKNDDLQFFSFSCIIACIFLTIALLITYLILTKKEKRNKLWQFSFLFLFLYLKFINSVYFVTLLDR